ncbi:hypothetical protein [Duganella aceris]|uniref:Pilus assembly protein n=1 Tax=Duganella aceris TaxID=2703883 RepID=A0ABX0FPC7_9BURK|nr:hypothetical protein [Duganella aceris]NGZ86502.1 hypothetical protein [Duganella aceris]
MTPASPAMPYSVARLLMLCASAAALSACSVAPRVERDFGNSLRLAQAQQTLYPEARRNLSPVNGLDAQAAKSAYDNYQKSYAEPDKQGNGFTIGVGAK